MKKTLCVLRLNIPAVLVLERGQSVESDHVSVIRSKSEGLVWYQHQRLKGKEELLN